MAGGPTTVDLVVAASAGGAFPFIAGAYKPATELAEEIAAVRSRISGRFGVNVFVPGRPTRDPASVDEYLSTLAAEAAHLEVALGEARWDDDGWDDKIEVLIDAAPAIASFTFGCPPVPVIESLQRRGSLVVVTVTSPAEAAAAISAGADLLCAQGIEAGAHRGSFDDAARDEEMSTLALVQAIRSYESVSVIAAGGLSTPSDVRAALDAGAVAVQSGTAFLLADEAGTNAVHRAALVSARSASTALTRAFTGRRARGLVNGFMQRHPAAPSAFPEIHNAVRPLRTAAAAIGDPDRLNLWAGTAHQHARAAPAAEIIDWLASDLPD
jgi:nitronate monooxygenase